MNLDKREAHARRRPCTLVKQLETSIGNYWQQAGTGGRDQECDILRSRDNHPKRLVMRQGAS